MGEKFEQEIDVIVLTDEDGQDHEFELIEILEVDDQEYAVLAPLDGEEEVDDEDVDFEDEAIILRVETDANGDRVFCDIESDEEWDKVAEAWESSLDDDLEEWDEDEEEEEDQQ